MDNKELSDLLVKYRAGTCTEEERDLLENWISSTVYPEYQISEEDLQEDLLAISKDLPVLRKEKVLWPRILTAAASIVLIIGVGLYFYPKEPAVQQKNAVAPVNKIVPGKNTATLTLSNGKKIVLSDMLNGEIAKESGLKISKTKNGQIVYEIEANDNAYIFNTLSTAKGETYQVRLPDGTLVALNSASSLKYATAANKSGDRVVELNGEAYFEVKRDEKHPFIVKTDKQEIKVLGTHFNISNYDSDQEVKTTLLEGKVQVTAKNSNNSEFLNPGQQSVLSTKGFYVKSHVDIEEAVAWKNGYFKFNGSLEDIMRKVARWYDIEVIYKKKPDPNLAFGAEISMQRDITALLKIIEETGNVRFKIEGRRVFVM
jgi:transmembrane sensor